MLAEVQIAELAVNQARAEGGCAEMAAEGQRALFQGRAPRQACAAQQRTGIGVGLTPPTLLPPPARRLCTGTPVAWRNDHRSPALSTTCIRTLTLCTS